MRILRFTMSILLAAQFVTSTRADPTDSNKSSVSPVKIATPRMPPEILGTWKDVQVGLISNAMDRFEAIDSAITFMRDGTFTLVISKSGGATKEPGYYAINGNEISLNYAYHPDSPAKYLCSFKSGNWSFQSENNLKGPAIILLPMMRVSHVSAQTTFSGPAK
jgi:hypothetical protein